MTLPKPAEHRFNGKGIGLVRRSIEMRSIAIVEKRIRLTRFSSPARGLLWFGALAVALLMACAVGRGLALAQSATPVPQEEAAPVAGTVAEGVTADEVNAVARELWCPLCSGVRLDSCELKACDQMKDEIAIKLAEGEDAETIKAYFLEQYGPQVLGEPPRQGFNWLAWILPVVAVVVGGGFFWRMTRRMVQPAPQPSAATAPRRAETEDDYERKLEEELAKYG